MTVDDAPYPNSKGEDIDTPPVNRLPKVKPPDFSHIRGHACSQIPAFIDRQKRFESLSGSYYKTKPDGSYDAVDYNPKDHSGNGYKIFEENGQKKAVIFYNYGAGFQNIDIEFDPKQNVLVFNRKIIFIPKTVINTKDGKEYPYENQPKNAIDLKLIERNITNETMGFIQNKQDIVNELLNHEGYYLSPSDCNVVGGCTCSIPVLLKVTMQVQKLSDPRPPNAMLINLYPSASRADSGNWGEVALKEETYTKHEQPTFKNGTVISPPPIQVKEERAFDTTTVFLHEAGHLFGFPDEYFADGGAVHKMYIKTDTQTVDVQREQPRNDWQRKTEGTLMSAAIPGKVSTLPAYYYEQFRQYFENKTGVRWEIKKLNK